MLQPVRRGELKLMRAAHILGINYRQAKRMWKRYPEYGIDGLHDPVDEQQKTLNAKLRGHYQYYGRPTNYRSLWQFYREVRHIWKG